jgi:hypothetical protein
MFIDRKGFMIDSRIGMELTHIPRLNVRFDRKVIGPDRTLLFTAMAILALGRLHAPPFPPTIKNTF